MRIANEMAAAILLFIAALQLAAAQELRISAEIIRTDGTETCPSQENRENALLNIRNDTWTTLANFTIIPECGNGLWNRVAYLNMSDPLEQCPSAWRMNSTNGVRACGRPVTSNQSCSAVIYPTGQHYQRVCGRIIGYQMGTTDAFLHYVYDDHQTVTLDDPYVDGVSITHGHPRKHIWTFGAGVSESTNQTADCPCSGSSGRKAPDYISNDYYCESGNLADSGIYGHLYSGDPLWDGQQCEGQCCSNGKSPPWFIVQLSNPTLDDIEVRICADEGTDNEDTPVELIEIYVS